jgi:hypothetical protein
MTGDTHTAPRIRLLGRDNGAGLSRDLALLAETLRDVGACVDVRGLPHRGRLAAWLTALRWRLSGPSHDLNLMLERIRPEFLRAARRNVLVPNPEYFRAADRAALPRLDEVWVKTRHAVPLFEALGARVRYVGFTSEDRRDATVPRRHAFFHGPGRSGNKGTQALLALWARHPEWPPLTVVWRRRRALPAKLPANVVLHRDHLDDAAYRRLQNAHRFHLCPSQTEGYGHYIAEAMSCGAVVVTLDAPPMHELVTSVRGVLIAAHAVGRQDLATLYAANEEALRAAIERCIGMEASEAERLGAAARAWFDVNHAAFPQRLREALRGE